MPNTEAPNDQEVLFPSVALFPPPFFATAARATASQEVELSDEMYFVEEKRSMPIGDYDFTRRFLSLQI